MIDLLDPLEAAPPFGEDAPTPGDCNSLDLLCELTLDPPFCACDAVATCEEVDLLCVLTLDPPFCACVAGPIVVGDAEFEWDFVSARLYGNGDWPPDGGPHSIPNNAIYRSKPMFEPSLAEQKDILTKMMASAAWGPGSMEVHLGTADIEPDKNMVFGDLGLADFDGYAPITNLDFNPPTLDNDGDWEVVAKVTSQFVCTGNTKSNEIFLYGVKDKAGTFVGAERLEESQIMAKNGDSISFTVRLKASLFGAVALSP